MQLTRSTLASALFAIASAQNTPNLTALIANTPSLSGLGTVLELFPNIATSLASAENVTLFAPNNAAINALQQSGALQGATEEQVAAILNYHVIPAVVYSDAITETPTFANTLLNDTAYTNVTDGQVVEVALDGQDVVITSGFKLTANVVTADVNFTGGVAHIIDSVLTVPQNVSSTAVAAGLTALAGAITAADLVDTLDTASDITIFAPTNLAFAAIGSAARNLSTQQLTSILEYHVINGTIAYSSSLGNGSVTTLGGDDLTITVEDGAVFVNSARVIIADILVAGGVVHVIDSVLNPGNATAEPDPSATTGVAQFSGASSASLPALTTGIPAASTTYSGLTMTTDEVASGYSTQTGGAVGTGAGGAQPTGGNGGGSGSGGSGSSSSSGMAAMPTGAIGAAALFGGAALLANF